MKYTEQQRAEFLERASEIGITRAKRELGYPHSWVTGKAWADSAGIELPLDEIKAQAKAAHDWYTTEEMLVVAQQGVRRTAEVLANEDLTPDEHKKMSEAFQKYANTWLLLQGKANNINETRHKDSTDIALMELFNEEKMKNEELEKEDKS